MTGSHMQARVFTTAEFSVSARVDTPKTTSFFGSECGFGRLYYICGLAIFVVAAAVGAVLLLRRGQPKVDEPGIPSAALIQTISTKAQNGDVEAQFTLGSLFSKGSGVKQDYQQAAKWFQRAAEQGNAQAQSALGELFEAGQGVAHDEQQAAAWYRRAAEQGLAAAQYNLAALYAVGKGVKLSNAEALQWYLQAANQGDSLAQYNVGMRYSEGHGITRDPTLAYKWLSLSAAQGLPDASRALGSLKESMSSEQLARARVLRQFKPGRRADR